MISALIKLVTHSIGSLNKRIKIALKCFPQNYDDCEIAHSCSFACPENLSLGRWIYIGPKSFIEAKGGISIEDGAVISSHVTILSSNHDYNYPASIPYGGRDALKPVRIKQGAWICYGAIILPGVTIGEGAIVGAGAVVTKDVQPGHMVGGNPAKIIGARKNENWRQLIANKKYRVADVLNSQPSTSGLKR